MQNESLGLIETWGYTAAVEAVDAACKAAVVSFIGHDLVGKGLVTAKFTGDVAAVKAAVTAGAAAAGKVGRVVSVHVIPRPHAQLGAFEPGPPSGPARGAGRSLPGGSQAARVHPTKGSGREERLSGPVAAAEPPGGKSGPKKIERPRRRTKAEKAGPGEAPTTKESEIKRKKKKKE